MKVPSINIVYRSHYCGDVVPLTQINYMKNTNIIKYIYSSVVLRVRQVKDKQWISRREVRPFTMLVLWITLTAFSKEFLKSIFSLEARVLKLWDNNGTDFTFHYLKGCQHALIRYFAGTPLSETYKSKVLVKVDKNGLPSILPLSLRLSIVDYDRILDIRKIVALLSFIGIYRVLKTKPAISFDTITDKFSGVSDTLSGDIIDRVLRLYNVPRIGITPFRLYKCLNCWRSARQSLWGAEIDAFALFGSNTLFHFLKLCLKSYSFLTLGWFLCIIILGSPYYLVSRLFRDKPVNGRLSIVYNQAGKARVVAMTNWWIQCAFRGLHDKIFKILECWSSDATFDQEGRLSQFVERQRGKRFFCYDLSAATDRLPVRLQADILEKLGYPGGIWSDIISSISWKYKSRDIKYSVGQPMGAYSSWAMLALTHHVIVMYSAYLAGFTKSKFEDYLVLGDDIVIANEEVANCYLSIMANLGVSINLSKSIISSEIVEFAKKWKSFDYDISPIGSGLLLQSIREKTAFISLVATAWERKLLSWKDIIMSQASAPKAVRPKIQYVIWHVMLIKINALFKESLDENKFSIKDLFFKFGRLKTLHIGTLLNSLDVMNIEFDYASKLEQYSFILAVSDVLRKEARLLLINNFKDLWKSFKHLLFYSWRLSTLRIGLPDFFDLLLLPIKPGILIHIVLLIKGFGESLNALYIFYRVELYERYFVQKDFPPLMIGQKIWFYSQIIELDLILSFYDSEEVKRKGYSKLLKNFAAHESSRDLLSTLKRAKQKWNINHIKFSSKKEAKSKKGCT
uniref:RNA-dependent RNA polymerase n=1 Tax=Hypoxylon fendleri mitovirus 1 TaxID=3079707 RepID=A0AA96Q766_9VIRU|nr:RNA-dependent RNA polymerase [Hypoxylon fendleri mitovirus 1]